GIYVHGTGASGATIRGNYVGTDAIGENALGNEDFGVWINDNAASSIVGGSLPGQGNLISGNGSTITEGGISVGLSSSFIVIWGNLIGTDRTGTQRLGNIGPGISVTGGEIVSIGAPSVTARNVIAANDGGGIRLSSFSRDVTIEGNHIGVGITGSETSLGNSGDGIFMSSAFDPSNNVVGGLQPGEGNLIAYNDRGILTQGSGQGDEILGNVVRDNGTYGIESATDGAYIAVNTIWNHDDPGLRLRNDSGTGANNNQVFHNTIHGNNDDGVLVEGTGVDFRNNIVTGNAGFGINVSGGSVTESFNTVTDASSAPANAGGRSNVALAPSTINLDPQYVDSAGGDFALTACSSPAIDAGQDLGASQPDVNGTSPGNFNGTDPDMGAFETACTGPAVADLELTMSDAPDPAPVNGPLVYSLVITNNGGATASAVTLTDTLPASVNFVSANASQGSCSDSGSVVTCNLGAILNAGTASVEIQVVTTTTGSITNNASVSAAQSDPVPGNNSAAETTSVTASSGADVPLSQFLRIAGFLDYEVTGATLRTQPNSSNACSVGGSASAPVSGIPATATVRNAYLYWAGSGATTDTNVTLDSTPISADRTFESDFVLSPDTYEFFGGFADVTAQVAAKGNGTYTFSGLTVDNGGIYCSANAVIAGWSLMVIYEDTALTGKTLVVYDGFDITRNGSTSYVLSGIFASPPPEAR
ncbi:MAG: right-handed parallel beta-helix repeat-containing protein, partial [Pseudomonadota bacterium]